MSLTDIIAQDTSSITITRHTKVKHAGGFSWTDTVLAPQTGRIYNFTTRNQREVTLPEGEVKTIVLGLLFAGVTADVYCGHDAFDTFDLYTTASPPELRTYRIVGVRRYDDTTCEANTQCDCVAA